MRSRHALPPSSRRWPMSIQRTFAIGAAIASLVAATAATVTAIAGAWASPPSASMAARTPVLQPLGCEHFRFGGPHRPPIRRWSATARPRPRVHWKKRRTINGPRCRNVASVRLQLTHEGRHGILVTPDHCVRPFQQIIDEALVAPHAGCPCIAPKREEAQTDCLLTRLDRVMHACNEVTLCP
jgi:hypothetical protein